MSLIKDDKPRPKATTNNDIQQILSDNKNDMKTLLETAKKAQKSFLDSIQFD